MDLEQTHATLNAAAFNAEGNPSDSQARFYGQISMGDNYAGSGRFSSQTPLQVTGRIEPATDDIGQVGEILRVARYQGDLYMKTFHGWAPWDGNLSTLIAAEAPRAFRPIEDIEIERGVSLPGDYEVFFGYRKDGQVHYTGLPLTFSLLADKQPEPVIPEPVIPVPAYLINGIAVDDPLNKATVDVRNSRGELIATTVTNAQGNYSISADQPGPYRITVINGTLNGQPFKGRLTALCATPNNCAVTPFSTVLLSLMDTQALTQQQALALISARLGFSQDPFITANPAFDLIAARRALNNGAGLDNWITGFAVWILDSRQTPPAGIPVPAAPEVPAPDPEPVTPEPVIPEPVTPAPEPAAPAPPPVNSYTLTYSADANGSLTGTALQTVNHGSSSTAITGVAASGYHFDKWSDNSTSTSGRVPLC